MDHGRHFIHDDAKRPKVGVKREHALVLEQLGRHVVDTTGLLHALLLLIVPCRVLDEVRDFLGKTKICKLQLTELVDEYVSRL